MDFFIKLDRLVNHGERMNRIDFGGQRSKVKVTMDIYENKLVNTIEDLTVVCFLIKLGRNVRHGERMNPIDFESQRSKVKVTMDIYFLMNCSIYKYKFLFTIFLLLGSTRSCQARMAGTVWHRLKPSSAKSKNYSPPCHMGSRKGRTWCR